MALVRQSIEGDALVTGSTNYTVLDVIGDGTGMIALMLEDDQVRLSFIETRNGLASFPAKPFRSKTIHSQVKTVLINPALSTPAWDDSIDNKAYPDRRSAKSQWQ